MADRCQIAISIDPGRYRTSTVNGEAGGFLNDYEQLRAMSRG